MSSSRKLIRQGGSYQSFHATLAPLERVDMEEVRRKQQAEDLETLKSAAYEEGQARGYRDGFDAGRSRGHEEGHSAGLAAATAEFEADHAGVLENLQASLEALLADFHQARSDWFRAAEARYADLAYEVARRALSAELAVGRESVLAIAQEVLSEVRSGTSVTVRVNPVDVSVMEAHRAQLTETLAGIRGIEVVADREVGAGVVIETNEGLVDARVETFLERMVGGYLQEAA